MVLDASRRFRRSAIPKRHDVVRFAHDSWTGRHHGGWSEVHERQPRSSGGDRDRP